MKATAPVLITLSVLVILSITLVVKGTANAGISGGEIDAISIDMDPSSSPANTATSIGSREFCARINANGVQDADEDDVDTLEIDVMTGPEGIPEAHPMIAFDFRLLYPPEAISITGRDVHFLLAANEGSQIFDASEPVPDTDGEFVVPVLDLEGVGNPEYGPGVLARLSITANPDSPSGVHHLLLEDAVHVDPQNEAFLPVVLNHAVVAIDTECPAEQPEPSFPATPTPGQGEPTPSKSQPITPTQSPTPTATPTPTMEPFPTPTATPFPTPTAVGGADEDSGIGGGSPAELPKTGGLAGGGGIGLMLAAIGAAFAGGAFAVAAWGLSGGRGDGASG